MEVRQYIGPFKQGDTITIPSKAGCVYTHIGIQAPKVQPHIIPTEEDYLSDASRLNTIYKVRINDSGNQTTATYYMNDNTILEFDGLAEINWEINFLTNFPTETIIDIIQKT